MKRILWILILSTYKKPMPKIGKKTFAVFLAAIKIVFGDVEMFFGSIQNQNALTFKF